MSGENRFLRDSTYFLIVVPSYGKKPSRKPSTRTFLFRAPRRKRLALLSASFFRSRLELKTTQETSRSGCSSSQRRTVPPQPISISSECAPRHNILRAE